MKPLFAHIAGVGLLAGVHTDMRNQITFLRILDSTLVTFEWLLPGVHADMFCQITVPPKLGSTVCAFLLRSVQSTVFRQTIPQRKLGSAVFALKRLLPGAGHLVLQQGRLAPEPLPARARGEPPSVGFLVSAKAILASKFLAALVALEALHARMDLQVSQKVASFPKATRALCALELLTNANSQAGLPVPGSLLAAAGLLLGLQVGAGQRVDGRHLGASVRRCRRSSLDAVLWLRLEHQREAAPRCRNRSTTWPK